MTKEEILAAIAANPELQALAAVRNDGEIARIISIGRVHVVSKVITSRGIASAYPGGPLAAEMVLLKLEGARDAMLASADPSQKVLGSLLRRQLAFLATEGLDFGDLTLRGMIDSFATPQAGNIISPSEAAALKSMAVVPDVIFADVISAALNGGQ